MYAYERKRVLARLKWAEKKGLPAHDSACINEWIKKADWRRQNAKDKTIPADVRNAFYKRAISNLLYAQDLLRSFENSVTKPAAGLEDGLKEPQ